jgi:hypothetical protein
MRKYLLINILALFVPLVLVSGAYAGSVTLSLKRATLKNVDDAAGRWQYSGGKVYKGTKHIGYYATIRRVTFGATDPQNTAMVTLTIFFLREKPPQNITLQGAHDFNSGKYIGSVSAASSKYNGIRDASFTGDTSNDTLILDWLGSNTLTLP